MIETICSKCGVKTIENSHSLSLHRDGKDIPLYHPGESYQLEEFGLTMEKAARAGMLHLVKAYVCRRCGAVSYVKSLSLPGELTGVFTLVVLLLTTVFAVFISRNPWWCALVVLAALVPAAWFDVSLSRKRVSRKHGFPVDTSCRSCGTSETVEINTFILDKDARLLCSSCGERQRFCHSTWIS